MRRTIAIFVAALALGLVSTSAARADELPTCSVHANAPVVTLNGTTATGFGTGANVCSADVSLNVVGVVVSILGGSSNANGMHCQNCSSVSATAGPALGAQAVFTCATTKASGSAAGAVTAVPFTYETYCIPPVIP